MLVRQVIQLKTLQNELGRQAIMADKEWNKGNYLDTGESPSKGLAVARQLILFVKKRIRGKIW